eukprot:SM000366S13818  [mRNA]  locus=s366:61728:70586:+ [translate_table: standard]
MRRPGRAGGQAGPRRGRRAGIRGGRPTAEGSDSGRRVETIHTILRKPKEEVTALLKGWNSSDEELRERLQDETQHPDQPQGLPPSEEPTAFDVLRDEVIKYGEFAQTTYDALETKNIYSSRFGRSRLDPDEYLASKSLTLTSDDGRRYKVVTALLYADSGAYKLVESSSQVKNFVGFVAHSDPAENKEVDVAVVWRGTITKGEWLQDIKALMVSWNNGQGIAPLPSQTLPSNPFKVLGINVGLGVGAFGGVAYILSTAVLQDMPLLPSVATAWKLALPLGITAAAISGMLSLGPIQWVTEAGKVPVAAFQWFMFWLEGTWRSRMKFDDPRVSFGFKEMYCDAREDKLASPGSSEGDAPPLGSPRQQVYKELYKILDSVEKSGGRVSSITTTGHSLGGALASLSAFDIAETLREAKKIAKLQLDKQDWKKFEEKSTDRDEMKDAIYRQTEECRQDFIEKLVDGQKAGYELPTVTAVTFAAPRVGDRLFAQRFGPQTLMAPPFAWGPEGLHAINYFTLLDTLPFALGSVALAVGPGLYDNLFWIATTGLAGGLFLQSGQPEAVGGARMLRVRNIHDLVPKVPLGLASGRWFTHGGYEVLRNAYKMKEYRRSSPAPFIGNVPWASVGGRHNLEVYLRMMDPTRDHALMNKTDDVLVVEKRVPPCWFSPTRNLGLYLQKSSRRWCEWPLHVTRSQKALRHVVEEVLEGTGGFELTLQAALDDKLDVETMDPSKAAEILQEVKDVLERRIREEATGRRGRGRCRTSLPAAGRTVPLYEPRRSCGPCRTCGACRTRGARGLRRRAAHDAARPAAAGPLDVEGLLREWNLMDAEWRPKPEESNNRERMVAWLPRSDQNRGDTGASWPDWCALRDEVGIVRRTIYDAPETKNVFSSRFGQCRLDKDEYLTSRSLTFTSPGGKRYQVKALLYADSGAYKSFKASPQVKNFVGFVGHSDPADGNEVDFAIIWRGTITTGEWFQVLANPARGRRSDPVGVLGHERSAQEELGITVGLSVGAVVGFIILVTGTLQSRPLLPLAAAAWEGAWPLGVTAAVASGLLSAGPKQWAKNMVGLLRAAFQWLWFWLESTWRSRMKFDDPRVSYGFKEMYCDALPTTLASAAFS